MDTADPPPRARGPRPPARGVRGPADGPARRPAGGGGADGALAEHQRPQPRRRLPAPARAPADVGGGTRRAAGGSGGGDPAGGHLEGQVRAHPADLASHLRGPIEGRQTRSIARALARLAGGSPAGGGARLPDGPAGGGSQDGGVRAVVRVRPARGPRRHARLACGDAPGVAAPRRAVSRNCTTRCLRSRPPARSWSYMSTSCATAAAPATLVCLRAASARWRAGARAGGASREVFFGPAALRRTCRPTRPTTH